MCWQIQNGNVFHINFLCASTPVSQQLSQWHEVNFVGKQLCTALSEQEAKSFVGVYS